MAPLYSSLAEFEAWADPGYTIADSAIMTKRIERAEEDIDRYVGPWSVEATLPPRKFGTQAANPKGLTTEQWTALKNAVHAQAYWRNAMKDEWFWTEKFAETTGPDYTTKGTLSRVSTQAKDYLAGSGLVIRSAVLR